MAEAAGRLVELEDGVSINVVEVGSGHPLIMLHGGPGLDHHELHPWLDPLAGAGFRLIYVDMRGQGASERVDPSTLTVQVFAQDVDRLARALDLGEFSLYGHSFGAVVSLAHALERGTASHYVISSGAASSEALMADVEHEIDRFEPAAMREQIKRSWDAEPTVSTVTEAREVMESQWPFHFWEMGDAYRAFTERDETVYSPEVLAGVRRVRVGRPPPLDLEANARHDRALRPHVHGCPLGGDPRRGGRVAACHHREGGAHDAHRAAEGRHGRDPHLVHGAGRDRAGARGGRAGRVLDLEQAYLVRRDAVW
jgi:pimeloyl-ACP methyl ester carboxylesterase